MISRIQQLIQFGQQAIPTLSPLTKKVVAAAAGSLALLVAAKTFSRVWNRHTPVAKVDPPRVVKHDDGGAKVDLVPSGPAVVVAEDGGEAPLEDAQDGADLPRPQDRPLPPPVPSRSSESSGSDNDDYFSASDHSIYFSAEDNDSLDPPSASSSAQQLGPQLAEILSTEGMKGLWAENPQERQALTPALNRIFGVLLNRAGSVDGRYRNGTQTNGSKALGQLLDNWMEKLEKAREGVRDHHVLDHDLVRLQSRLFKIPYLFSLVTPNDELGQAARNVLIAAQQAAQQETNPSVPPFLGAIGKLGINRIPNPQFAVTGVLQKFLPWLIPKSTHGDSQINAFLEAHHALKVGIARTALDLVYDQKDSTTGQIAWSALYELLQTKNGPYALAKMKVELVDHYRKAGQQGSDIVRAIGVLNSWMKEVAYQDARPVSNLFSDLADRLEAAFRS